MKIIRSVVAPEYQEEVKEMVKKIIPEYIPITKISAGTKELRPEDILWSVELA